MEFSEKTDQQILYHIESEAYRMSTKKEHIPELPRNEYTEFIFGETCLEDPTDPQSVEDLTSGIERAG